MSMGMWKKESFSQRILPLLENQVNQEESTRRDWSNYCNGVEMILMALYPFSQIIYVYSQECESIHA